MRYLLLVLFCLSLTSYAFDPILEPRGEVDFGLSVTQVAKVYQITPDDIIWMDGDLMRQRYPRMAKADDNRIKQFLTTQPIAHLTTLQYAWENILWEGTAQPVGETDVVHPPLYLRGDFLNMTFQNIFGTQFVGSLDGKGGGMSFEGERLLRVYERPLAFILGKEVFTKETDFAFRSVCDELHRTIAQLRTAKASYQERIQRAKSAEVRRGREHGLRHRVELPLQLAQLLRANMKKLFDGKPVTDADRAAVIKILRQMDYTNGLLPESRGLKEGLMGVAHHLAFAKYNEVHGTDFGIVRPLFVVRLPIYIIMPDGTKERACILYREPHWRALLSHEKFRKLMPTDVVSGVLAGGMQFDIFGRMVDLELPEIKLAPLSRITGFSEHTGHPIDRRAAWAVREYEGGDLLAIQRLEAEIRDLASQIVVPEKPSHAAPPYPKLEARFMGALKMLRDYESHRDEVQRAVRELVMDDHVIDERREVLLIKLLESDVAAGTAVLGDLIDHKAKRAYEAMERTKRVRGIEASFVIGPIRNVLLNLDPTHMGGDEDPARTFVKRIRENHPKLFDAMICQCQNLFKKVFSMMGQAEFEGLYGGSPIFEIARVSVQVLIKMQDQLIAAKGNVEEAKKAWDKMTVEIGAASRPTKELFEFIHKTPHFEIAIYMVADMLNGGFIDESIIRYFDPDDESQMLKTRAILIEQMAELKAQLSHVEQTRQMAASCGGQVVMVGGMPLVVMGGGGGLGQLAQMMGAGGNDPAVETEPEAEESDE